MKIKKNHDQNFMKIIKNNVKFILKFHEKWQFLFLANGKKFMKNFLAISLI